MEGTDELLKIIKQAAMDAVKQSEPMELTFGTVLKTNPLTIKLDQKLTLPKEFFVVTKEVKNTLTEGKVVLLKANGGQKYLVLGMEG